MTLDFNEEKHKYTLDGQNVPSVTEVIERLHGSFADIGQSVLDAAARRGSAIHEATELIDIGADFEEIEQLDAETWPYLQAYLQFLKDYQPEYLFSEQKVACDGEMPYAGTVDRIAVIDGKAYIMDIKTTASASRENKIAWATQLAAYKVAVIRSLYTETSDGLILRLAKDGTYHIYFQTEIEDTYKFSASDLFMQCREITKIVKGY